MESTGIKFDGSDFAGWKQKVEAKLKKLKLWNVVTSGQDAEEKLQVGLKKVKGADVEGEVAGKTSG